MSKTYRNLPPKRWLCFRYPRHVSSYRLEQSVLDELKDDENVLLDVVVKRNRLVSRANPSSSNSPPSPYEDLCYSALFESWSDKHKYELTKMDLQTAKFYKDLIVQYLQSNNLTCTVFGVGVCIVGLGNYGVKIILENSTDIDLSPLGLPNNLVVQVCCVGEVSFLSTFGH